MTPALIGLTIAYVALAILLLSLNLATRWPVWVKAGTILLVGGFYFVSYASLSGMLGWPTRAMLPERFVLLALSVHEPDKKSGRKGAIYLWATGLEGAAHQRVPRAYRLPYAKGLHEQLERAQKQLRQGVVQLGRRETIEETNAPLDMRRLGSRGERIRIYDLPDPALPEK